MKKLCRKFGIKGNNIILPLWGPGKVLGDQTGSIYMLVSVFSIFFDAIINCLTFHLCWKTFCWFWKRWQMITGKVLIFLIVIYVGIFRRDSQLLLTKINKHIKFGAIHPFLFVHFVKHFQVDYWVQPSLNEKKGT